jgi:hypothetical protein
VQDIQEASRRYEQNVHEWTASIQGLNLSTALVSQQPSTEKQHPETQLSLDQRELAALNSQEQMQQRQLLHPTRQPSRFRSNMKEYLSSKHNLSCLQRHIEVSDDGVCRGYLIKQGELVKDWKKRFFVFDPSRRTFTYYSDHTQKQMKGIIYFDAIQSVWCGAYDGATKWMHKFYIQTHQRKYKIKAETHDVMRAWHDILSTTLEDADTSWL